MPPDSRRPRMLRMALPAGYTLRAPRKDDGPRVVAMLNEESVALAGVAVADPNWVTAPWPPQPVPGIRIRSVQAGEEPMVYDCLAEAFEDHWNGLDPKPRWLHTHVEVDTFDRTLWFVALERDRIVGALVGRLASVEEPRLGDVNTLGVRRPARGRGVGEALLRAGFAAFAARGQDGAVPRV